MSKIAERFSRLRVKDERALVLFVTAGDQPLSELPDLLASLEEAGADLVEVGIPFSDPFGEGPTIQGSSQRSLESGTTPRAVLEAVSKCSLGIPIVTMGYYNPVLRLGLREFAHASAAAGVSGTIISDLVPDESGPWREASVAAGLDTIFLAAPTSTEQRIREVAACS
ncbi:MAG TPA: tryptophan synthase subunit alpha, partial [Fimbriimonadaceae bacterium]|nr:tryptophan synthase subunit alpha [Fimbriimonadaceae bacterium]